MRSVQIEGISSNPSFCSNIVRPFFDETYAIAIYAFVLIKYFRDHPYKKRSFERASNKSYDYYKKHKKQLLIP